MKSCFYPLIGDRIFGWIGDLIDIASIMSTLFGVCTSLGLGARQLNAGFHVVNPDIHPDDITIQVNALYVELYLLKKRLYRVSHRIRNMANIFVGSKHLVYNSHCHRFNGVWRWDGNQKIIRSMLLCWHVSDDGCFLDG